MNPYKQNQLHHQVGRQLEAQVRVQVQEKVCILEPVWIQVYQVREQVKAVKNESK